MIDLILELLKKEKIGERRYNPKEKQAQMLRRICTT